MRRVLPVKTCFSSGGTEMHCPFASREVGTGDDLGYGTMFSADIGIAVGKNTPYKYIVVNVHYLHAVKNDFSGNGVIFTRKRSVSVARREGERETGG